MIERVADSRDSARSGARPASAHSVPYPDRLHAHLSAAVDAAAALAASPASERAPTPSALVDRYGASEGVNPTESEVTENG